MCGRITHLQVEQKRLGNYFGMDFFSQGMPCLFVLDKQRYRRDGDDRSSKPLAMVLTEFHMLVLYPDR